MKNILLLPMMLLYLQTDIFAQNRSFNQLILDNHIDLKSKSLKSWMRIFNSEDKMKELGFKMNNAERFVMIKGLKEKENDSKKRYSRRIR
jgi:hypothetical protein